MTTTLMESLSMASEPCITLHTPTNVFACWGFWSPHEELNLYFKYQPTAPFEIAIFLTSRNLSPMPFSD